MLELHLQIRCDSPSIKVKKKATIVRITDWHHDACRVMTNGECEGRIFFYPILTWIMNSFSCSPLNTSFYIGKPWKSLPENPEYAEMQHGDLILTLQWRHGLTCGKRAVDVCLFVKAGTGMWNKDDLAWVKTTIPIWCARKSKISWIIPICYAYWFYCLFCCMSTDMVMAGRSVHLTTLFPWQLTST